MQRLAFVFMFIASVMAFSPTAMAQSGGNQGIGDILGDIFGGGRGQSPGQYPYPSQQTLIDNIPVEIQFDPGAQGLPDESMLVVTAYAAPAVNVRRSRPLMLGETRLLLNGLNAPLNVVIAAPENVTRDIDYARVEAKIVDMNGNLLMESRQDGEYRGYDAPVMRLDRIGSSTTPPQTTTGTNTVGFETVRGSIDLNGPSPAFRGSTLVVRLVEDGLAGGASQTIAGEKRIDIDGRSAPFDFDFERPVMPGRQNIPLVFEAWIEDWAARKTHSLAGPTPYSGPATSYRLTLSEAVSGQYVPTPTTSQNLSQGLVRFDAFKGLASGSVLIVELERPNQTSRPFLIKEERIALDNKTGDIPFDLKLSSATFDPGLPTPVLRARIEDGNGVIYFSNPGGTPWSQGASVVELAPSPTY
jgi:hypothetical protein